MCKVHSCSVMSNSPALGTSSLSSMGLSKLQYWSSLPFPTQGNFLDRDRSVSLVSPGLSGGFFTTVPSKGPGQKSTVLLF